MTRTSPEPDGDADARVTRDARAVWQAGVDAVASERLVANVLAIGHGQLEIAGQTHRLDDLDRIVVVGAGKAGAGMAAAVENIARSAGVTDRVSGWVNVPADCVRDLERITLHPARPAGLNEPTEDGVHGTSEILRLVESLTPRDLCLCLISGGGSALLPAPAAGITLADKQAVTRHLSASGASIQELNTVRKQLSRIKGGRLALACRAGSLAALIISDVPGDPLDIIASGPTVPDTASAADALAVLDRFGGRESVPPAVYELLERRAAESRSQPSPSPTCEVRNIVIGSNTTAVDAAVLEAERLGYHVTRRAANAAEGQAEGVGRDLAGELLAEADFRGRRAIITGGEPVVSLPPAERRGRGGRNQQLALAALAELRNRTLPPFCLVSGGTDGEDGPTDAAGAVVNRLLVTACRDEADSIATALERADAYSFFAKQNALLKTGPTHTNVMDLRVLLIGE
jgi:hydroxypyruvate reductase